MGTGTGICLIKLAQEKYVVSITDRPDMTLAVDWDVKHQTKQTKLGTSVHHKMMCHVHNPDLYVQCQSHIPRLN